MSIDLFTFCAQIFNLLLLLYLLRRFLYLPVLKAVVERQKYIQRELRKASIAHTKAQELEAVCEKRIAEIEVERQQILASTRKQAEELAQRLTVEAQTQFEQAQKQWKKRLASQEQTFELAIGELVVAHFQKFANSALTQMADVNLNELIIEKLQEKIKNLPMRKKQEFAEAYQNKKMILVQSAQKLDASKKDELKRFISQQFGLSDEVKFKFAVNNKLVSGIAVQADDQLIAWNLATYFDEFQKNMKNDVRQMVGKE